MFSSQFPSMNVDALLAQGRQTSQKTELKGGQQNEQVVEQGFTELNCFCSRWEGGRDAERIK